MAEHILKVVAPYFDALIDGTKNFEVRENDRGFQAGDTLTLWEYTGRGCERFPCPSCDPAFVVRTVTYVYSGDPRFHVRPGQQWPAGTVVLGLGATTRAKATASEAGSNV